MQASPSPPSFLSASSSNSCTPDEFAEMAAKFSEDFTSKLRLNAFPDRIPDSNDEKSESLHQVEEQEDTEDEDDDEDFEFSFVHDGQDFSPVSAEDIFSEGRIRPVFPLFNRDLLFAVGQDDGDSAPSSAASLRPPLRKFYLGQQDPTTAASSSGTKDLDDQTVGPYCMWTGKAVETSPDACKKSSSTGFSKIWKFRDLIHRSSSDGKDAFVFLSTSSTSTKTKQKQKTRIEKAEATADKNSGASKIASRKKKSEGVRIETTSSAYRRNQAPKGRQKRRSYLPYRQDLVGFFTNVNGMSRNVHPF